MKTITYPATNDPELVSGTMGLPRPRKFTLVAAAAEGRTELTAFDKALLLAGVGNMNLLKVSSILPPEVEYTPELSIELGSLLPIDYVKLVSTNKDELISASVGVGIHSNDSYGIIMTFSGNCVLQDAEEVVSEMVEEAFDARNLKISQLLLKSIEHRVKNIGCVFAGVPLWY